MPRIEFRGAMTAMVTPFTQDGEVDYEGFRKNIRFQLKNRINGIVVMGTTGESPTLNREEKEKLIRVSVEEAKGKTPVIIGTGTNDTAKCVDESRRAEELGADALLVVTPYYNKPTDEGIYLHFKAINDAVSIPIIVYNIAGRTGKNIETSVMKRLAGLKNIAAVKEASGNISQMMDVLEQVPGMTVLCGDDALTFPLMALGGEGIISVASNLLPAEMVQLCGLMLRGKTEEARKLHFRLLPFFKAEFIETNPIPIKAAMNMKGLAAGGYRLPMCEMRPENLQKLRKVMQDMKII
ncbi:4-hydroxy-tetrahydrodipicolinate synthase [Candidatus Woesearchaeota archaeon CG10_big_fil_rev_8_21_14_0_10_44_13]|nr:MAG: 4-hydroxy-tetrahydrodipicolinate synthase [Candidatus Woesearchaeota archaeon CG10_big_fil_rev_8_21_14_0_10_44_13]